MKKLNKDIVYLGALILLAFFLFRSCGKSEEQQLEIARLENNAKAAQDTMRAYETEAGTMAAEITAYKLDLKKDKDIIEKMTQGYQDLKGQLVAAASGSAQIVEKKVEVPVEVKVYSDTTGLIALADSTIYNATNFSKLYVKAPYRLKGNYVTIENASYETRTALDLLIRFQEQKGTLSVIAETPHKGVQFSSITGGVVSAQDLPKSMKMALRREWGLGFSLSGGLGYNPATLNIAPVISFGVGINYTPKKLQIK
jgi:hypothetical protein